MAARELCWFPEGHRRSVSQRGRDVVGVEFIEDLLPSQQCPTARSWELAAEKHASRCRQSFGPNAELRRAACEPKIMASNVSRCPFQVTNSSASSPPQEHDA